MSDNIHGKPITREQAYEGLGDPSTWEAEEIALMKKFREKPNYEYPEETEGTRIAAEIREKCNKLTREQRMEFFQKGLEYINSKT